jgi:hypothetical protein
MSRGRCEDGTTMSRVLHDGRGDGEVAKGGALDHSSDDIHVAQGSMDRGSASVFRAAWLGTRRGHGLSRLGAPGSVGWLARVMNSATPYFNRKRRLHVNLESQKNLTFIREKKKNYLPL